jgi:hypothetical protein
MGVGFEDPGEGWDRALKISSVIFLFTSGVFDLATWWYRSINDTWYIPREVKNFCAKYDEDYANKPPYWQRSVGYIGFVCSVMLMYYAFSGNRSDIIRMAMIALSGIIMFAEMQQFVHNVMEFGLFRGAHGGTSLVNRVLRFWPYVDIALHMACASITIFHSSYPVLADTFWNLDMKIWVFLDPVFLIVFAFLPLFSMDVNRWNTGEDGDKPGRGAGVAGGEDAKGPAGISLPRFRWGV